MRPVPETEHRNPALVSGDGAPAQHRRPLQPVARGNMLTVAAASCLVNVSPPYSATSPLSRQPRRCYEMSRVASRCGAIRQAPPQRLRLSDLTSPPALAANALGD